MLIVNCNSVRCELSNSIQAVKENICLSDTLSCYGINADVGPKISAVRNCLERMIHVTVFIDMSAEPSIGITFLFCQRSTFLLT